MQNNIKILKKKKRAGMDRGGGGHPIEISYLIIYVNSGYIS